MSGLSLWLSPPSTSPISSYPTLLSERYSTIPFDAHATLVSDEIVPAGLSTEEILQKIREGVRVWKEKEGGEKGLKLVFKALEKGQKFYQCIYLTLILSSSLLTLHESLLTSFSLPPPSPPTYFPHLSLIYGNLSEGRKDEIMSDLKGERGEVAQVGKGVEVLGEREYEAREVLLVRTGGETIDWEILGRVSL